MQLAANPKKQPFNNSTSNRNSTNKPKFSNKQETLKQPSKDRLRPKLYPPLPQTKMKLYRLRLKEARGHSGDKASSEVEDPDLTLEHKRFLGFRDLGGLGFRALGV